MLRKVPQLFSWNLLLYWPGIILLGGYGLVTLYLSPSITFNIPALVIGVYGFSILFVVASQQRKSATIGKERERHAVVLNRCIAALDASLDGITILDAQGILSYINVSLLSMLGLNPENYKDYWEQDWKILFEDVVDESIQTEIAAFLRAEDSRAKDFTLIIRTEEGKERSLRISATILKNRNCIFTVHDMTEEKQVQSEKAELQDQFYQSQKMEAIGRLAGGIAHDFNNILAAINGYAEFLMYDLEENSPTHGFAENILQAGLRARSLVDQMLSFSRREESHRETMDLTASIKNTVTMLQASLPKTIKVEQHINVETARIKGNVGQITQVLMNLCVNASDAMEDKHGQLFLTIEEAEFKDFSLPKLFCEKLANPQDIAKISFKEVNASRTLLSLGTIAKDLDYYCLSIEDTGSGMSRTIMEHIFEPFFTTKPVDKGTGLGLAMVHGAVTSHQGCMIIDSTLGVGTIFKLYFPIDSTQIVENITEQEIEGEASSSYMVLLVEDQKDVREMVLKMLERMGIEAESACDGLEAITILRENPDIFDLVITDYNMPQMTGLELTQHAGLEFPDLPFILLSGYSQEKVSKLITEQKNIFATLRKPVGKDVLHQKIHSIISENRKIAA